MSSSAVSSCLLGSLPVHDAAYRAEGLADEALIGINQWMQELEQYQTQQLVGFNTGRKLTVVKGPGINSIATQTKINALEVMEGAVRASNNKFKFETRGFAHSASVEAATLGYDVLLQTIQGCLHEHRDLLRIQRTFENHYNNNVPCANQKELDKKPV